MKTLLIFSIILSIGYLNLCNSSETTKTSDVRNIEYGIKAIPPDISYLGAPVAMVTWEDNAGNNLLFITVTKETSEGDFRSQELYGYHFMTGASGSKELWKINDFVKECPFDITLSYIDGSLSINDLDNDGTGESSFLYKLGCRSDVSPDDMKLLMHEGVNKYALRGSMTLIMNGQVAQKGTMNVDPSFNNAPPEFLEFAKGQWSKYESDNVGQ